MQILLVDDDPGFRALLRTTFDVVDVDVEEADSAASAAGAIEASRPDVVVLDVRMPGMDGLAFCRALKTDPNTGEIGVVLLTGAEESTEAAGRAAGADALLRKPFRPLELLAVVQRLADGVGGMPFRTEASGSDEQVLLYAHDLRTVLEIERGQRVLLEKAYEETITALTSALESKDTGTRAHSQRVQRYAIELAHGVAPELADDPSAEYGFLLHDVGKIGIPDKILQKPEPLTEAEERLMKSHTVLGEQMLRGVAILSGEGLAIVRSHHERWDGSGYPDGLGGVDIPIGARIFALADTLDAMTSNRPYRRALRWDAAAADIVCEAGRQFDPGVVEAFAEREFALRVIHRELAAA